MELDWQYYQTESQRTAIYPRDRSLEYTVLGLCSEVGEIAEYLSDGWVQNEGWLNAIKSEVGDCAWYIAAIADALEVRLSDIKTDTIDVYGAGEPQEEWTWLVRASSDLAGLTKKAIRDDGGVVTPQRHRKLVNTLDFALLSFERLCHAIGSSPKAVTAANLNKLADRARRGVLQGSGDSR